MSEQKRGCGYRKNISHKNWDNPSVSDIDLAYLAGLIDGDGSIYINKRDRTNRGSLSFSVMLKIGGETAHIQSLKHQYGIGNFWVRRKTNQRHLAEWTITGNQARWLLQSLMPYLKLKREQAHIALAMPQCRTRWDASPDLRAEQHESYRRMKMLNSQTGRGVAEND